MAISRSSVREQIMKAPMKKKTPMMAKGGKMPKLGSGERFAKLTKNIAARGNVSNPAAVAASIGRKKYGAAKMAKMAAAGRKKG
jgi:hypothetical protein